MKTPTLVHCLAGKSRSASVVATYLMARDDVSWDEAIDWLRARRDVVEPNVFFATDRRRPLILKVIREFLAGNDKILESAREARQSLISSLRDRPTDSAPEDACWNVIEPGFAIGNAHASPETLQLHGFRHVVALVEQSGNSFFQAPAGVTSTVHTVQRHDLESQSGMRRVRRIVRDLASKRETQGQVCLLSLHDEFLGMLVACGCLMVERGFDIATAMWFIGSRRATIWKHAHALWSINWKLLLDTEVTRAD